MSKLINLQQEELDYLLALIKADQIANGGTDLSRGTVAKLKRPPVASPTSVKAPVGPEAEKDASGDLECPKNLLARIRPLSGARLPSDWNEAVRLLVRPYYAISKQMYDRVLALSETDSDIFLFDGKRPVVFGLSAGTYAMMPLNENYLIDG